MGVCSFADVIHAYAVEPQLPDVLWMVLMFGRFVNTVMLEGMCWHCHVGSVETLLSHCTIKKSIICALANICDSVLLSG